MLTPGIRALSIFATAALMLLSSQAIIHASEIKEAINKENNATPKNKLSTPVKLTEYEEAQLLYQRKKYSDCLSKLRKIEASYYFSDIAIDIQKLKIRALYANGNYRKAIKSINSLLFEAVNDPQIEEFRYIKILCYDAIMPDYRRDTKAMRSLLKALGEFRKLYPGSEHTNVIKEKIDIITNLLAEKEMAIGLMYQDSGNIVSALMKFHNIAHQKHSLRAEALYRLSECYYVLGIDEEVEKYHNVILQESPESFWAKKVVQLKKNIKTV